MHLGDLHRLFSLEGEGPTGAVGCGREGATLGGEGSTGTVGCGEREGSMNVLSRLATAAPWTATRRRMASKDGVVVGWVEGTGGSSSALGLPATLSAPLWHWKEGNPRRFLDGVLGKHVVGCRLGLKA